MSIKRLIIESKRELLISAAILLVFGLAYGAWMWSLNARAKQMDASREQLREANAKLADDLDAITSGRPYLSTCPLCQGKVSSAAEKCPHCGHPR